MLYWFYIFTKGNFSNICYLLTSKKKKKMWGKNVSFLLLPACSPPMINTPHNWWPFIHLEFDMPDLWNYRFSKGYRTYRLRACAHCHYMKSWTIPNIGLLHFQSAESRSSMRRPLHSIIYE